MAEYPSGCNNIRRIKGEWVMDLEGICTADQGNGDRQNANEPSNDNNPTLLLDFPGPCIFGYYFRKDTPSPLTNSWLYSEILNQVFIRMGNVVHVQFTLDESKAPSDDLFIRATPVYCSADHMHLPVNRCTLHSLEDDPRSEAHKDGICHCTKFNLVGHIIRSTSSNARYCFDPISSRHSVLVPIRHKIYDLLFTFACKSSCAKGMERRPIRVVFSLEDSNGLILGRCSLQVKICSCPKRDMDRGEREARSLGGLGGLRSKRLSGKQNGSPSGNGPGSLSSLPTSLSELIDPLSSVITSMDGVEDRRSENRISKLKADLAQALCHIQKLNDYCSSIEQVLDTFESDI